MTRPPRTSELQDGFAVRVRHCLERFAVSFKETVEATKEEAWYRFQLTTLDEKLAVSVVIVEDRFGVLANEAALYLDRDAWGDDLDGWIAESVRFLDSILSNQLRIRVRKAFLGRAVGAIWVEEKSAWSGDLFACRGKGVEHVFPKPWYRSS